MKRLTKTSDLSTIANRLKNEKSVAVMCHIRPDGDAIGSAVALYLSLNKIGVKTDVYCADNIPEKFNFIKSTLDFKRDLREEYTALVAVDSAEVMRLGDFAEAFYCVVWLGFKSFLTKNNILIP